MRNHSCVLPKNKQELVERTASFALRGLSSGAVVFGALDSSEIPAFFSEMQKTERQRALVNRAVLSGQLSIRTPEETYFPSGLFVPEESVRKISAMEESASERGFSGLYVFGVASFAVEEKKTPGANRIFEYEAQVNGILAKNRRIRALCVYERELFPEKIIEEISRIHR